MVRNKPPYGYLVSCPKIPQGVFKETLAEAKKEMTRQMRFSRESGISEVWSKAFAEKMIAKMKKKKRKR